MTNTNDDDDSKVCIGSFCCSEKALTELKHLVTSSMGPRGSVKAFVSPVGLLTLTSASKRIFSRLEVDNRHHCVQSILELAKTFDDGGLIFTATLIDFILIMRNNETAFEVIQRVYESALEKCKISFDFDRTSMLIAAVKTKLTSKHWLKSKRSTTSLALKVIEGFVKSMPESQLGKYHLPMRFASVRGRSEGHFRLENGIFILSPDQKNVEMEGKLRIVTLNLQLKADLHDLEEMKELGFESTTNCDKFMKRLLGFCVENEVKLVANQKVVDEEERRKFEKLGVLFLERLGRRDIEALAVIGRSELISGYNEHFRFGVVHAIKSVAFEDDKEYLRISSEEIQSQTLFTSHFNDEETEEVQVKTIDDSAVVYVSSLVMYSAQVMQYAVSVGAIRPAAIKLESVG